MQTDTPPTQQELLEAIRAATGEVFATMLNLELQQEDGFLTREGAAPASGLVSIIGLAGSWVGTGSVSCSAKLACQIASQLLLADCSGIDDEVLDAMAEVTNMIIGNVKTKLEERLGGMGLSTPTVIYGRNFQTRSARNQEWTVAPFSVLGERMFVQICIAPNKDAADRPIRPGFPIPHVLNI